MFKKIFNKVLDGRNLKSEEAETALEEILSGNISAEEIAGFLIALRMKGETEEEIYGFAKKMREKAKKVSSPSDTCDTCGTGGDNSHTFNVSTAAAILLASEGITIAKHGNRGVSSSSGSADILQKIGIKIEITAEEAEQWLKEFKFAFLFAPIYHPAMKEVALIRKKLGVRTIFNILGPLTNPANPKKQLIGVFSENYLEKIAKVMKMFGVEGFVVYGEPGIDEVSIFGETKAILAKNGIEKIRIFPEDFGIKRYDMRDFEKLKDTSPEKFLSVLKGEGEEILKDFIAVNGSLILYLFGYDLKSAYEKLKESLNEGKPIKIIERMREKSK